MITVASIVRSPTKSSKSAADRGLVEAAAVLWVTIVLVFDAHLFGSLIAAVRSLGRTRN
jgi:hypothetical protein